MKAFLGSGHFFLVDAVWAGFWARKVWPTLLCPFLHVLRCNFRAKHFGPLLTSGIDPQVRYLRKVNGLNETHREAHSLVKAFLGSGHFFLVDAVWAGFWGRVNSCGPTFLCPFLHVLRCNFRAKHFGPLFDKWNRSAGTLPT